MKYELYLHKTTSLIIDVNDNIESFSEMDVETISNIINDDKYSIKLDINSSKWNIDDLEEIDNVDETYLRIKGIKVNL